MHTDERKQERDALLQSIRTAASQAMGSHLTADRFRELTTIPISRVYKYFDSWTAACHEAGVVPGKNDGSNLTPNFSKGKEHSLSEVMRVAKALGVKTLSKPQFDSASPEVSSNTVAKLWGGWPKAIKAAGLEISSKYQKKIPFEVLAQEFLTAVVELKKVPTCHQLTRRTRHSIKLVTEKFAGYANFKKSAIEYLLASPTLPSDYRTLLQIHLDQLLPCPSAKSGTSTILPHATGGHLGFRAFVFSPTYENEVVSLFSTVAVELGFEIISQRPQFPDCEARRISDSRRKRYKKCLIEFELHSSDFQLHKHPIDGCDLIVCWEHDWKTCPVEVLELKKAIAKLPGWKH